MENNQNNGIEEIRYQQGGEIPDPDITQATTEKGEYTVDDIPEYLMSNEVYYGPTRLTREKDVPRDEELVEVQPKEQVPIDFESPEFKPSDEYSGYSTAYAKQVFKYYDKVAELRVNQEYDFINYSKEQLKASDIDIDPENVLSDLKIGGTQYNDFMSGIKDTGLSPNEILDIIGAEKSKRKKEIAQELFLEDLKSGKRNLEDRFTKLDIGLFFGGEGIKNKLDQASILREEFKKEIGVSSEFDDIKDALAFWKVRTKDGLINLVPQTQYTKYNLELTSAEKIIRDKSYEIPLDTGVLKGATEMWLTPQEILTLEEHPLITQAKIDGTLGPDETNSETVELNEHLQKVQNYITADQSLEYETKKSVLDTYVQVQEEVLNSLLESRPDIKNVLDQKQEVRRRIEEAGIVDELDIIQDELDRIKTQVDEGEEVDQGLINKYNKLKSNYNSILSDIEGYDEMREEENRLLNDKEYNRTLNTIENLGKDKVFYTKLDNNYPLATLIEERNKQFQIERDVYWESFDDNTLKTYALTFLDELSRLPETIGKDIESNVALAGLGVEAVSGFDIGANRYLQRIGYEFDDYKSTKQKRQFYENGYELDYEGNTYEVITDDSDRIVKIYKGNGFEYNPLVNEEGDIQDDLVSKLQEKVSSGNYEKQNLWNSLGAFSGTLTSIKDMSGIFLLGGPARKIFQKVTQALGTGISKIPGMKGATNTMSKLVSRGKTKVPKMKASKDYVALETFLGTSVAFSDNMIKEGVKNGITDPFELFAFTTSHLALESAAETLFLGMNKAVMKAFGKKIDDGFDRRGFWNFIFKNRNYKRSLDDIINNRGRSRLKLLGDWASNTIKEGGLESLEEVIVELASPIINGHLNELVTSVSLDNEHGKFEDFINSASLGFFAGAVLNGVSTANVFKGLVDYNSRNYAWQLQNVKNLLLDPDLANKAFEELISKKAINEETRNKWENIINNAGEDAKYVLTGKSVNTRLANNLVDLAWKKAVLKEDVKSKNINPESKRKLENRIKNNTTKIEAINLELESGLNFPYDVYSYSPIYNEKLNEKLKEDIEKFRVLSDQINEEFPPEKHTKAKRQQILNDRFKIYKAEVEGTTTDAVKHTASDPDVIEDKRKVEEVNKRIEEITINNNKKNFYNSLQRQEISDLEKHTEETLFNKFRGENTDYVNNLNIEDQKALREELKDKLDTIVLEKKLDQKNKNKNIATDQKNNRSKEINEIGKFFEESVDNKNKKIEEGGKIIARDLQDFSDNFKRNFREKATSDDIKKYNQIVDSLYSELEENIKMIVKIEDYKIGVDPVTRISIKEISDDVLNKIRQKKSELESRGQSEHTHMGVDSDEIIEKTLKDVNLQTKSNSIESDQKDKNKNIVYDYNRSTSGSNVIAFLSRLFYQSASDMDGTVYVTKEDASDEVIEESKYWLDWNKVNIGKTFEVRINDNPNSLVYDPTSKEKREITYQALMTLFDENQEGGVWKINGREYTKNDFKTLSLYENGVEVGGFIHLPSWINEENIQDEYVEEDFKKSVELRNKIIKEIDENRSVKIKVTERNNGPLMMKKDGKVSLDSSEFQNIELGILRNKKFEGFPDDLVVTNIENLKEGLTYTFSQVDEIDGKKVGFALPVNNKKLEGDIKDTVEFFLDTIRRNYNRDLNTDQIKILEKIGSEYGKPFIKDVEGSPKLNIKNVKDYLGEFIYLKSLGDQSVENFAENNNSEDDNLYLFISENRGLEFVTKNTYIAQFLQDKNAAVTEQIISNFIKEFLDKAYFNAKLIPKKDISGLKIFGVKVADKESTSTNRYSEPFSLIKNENKTRRNFIKENSETSLIPVDLGSGKITFNIQPRIMFEIDTPVNKESTKNTTSNKSTTSNRKKKRKTSGAKFKNLGNLNKQDC